MIKTEYGTFADIESFKGFCILNGIDFIKELKKLDKRNKKTKKIKYNFFDRY